MMIRQFSAGGFVYKRKDGEIQWLIRKPKANPDFAGSLGWTWPKGWIDKGENAEIAAIREVKEEVGVEAEIIGKIDTIKVFFKEKGELVMKTITYYLMRYVTDIPSGFGDETEQVKWVSTGEANDLLNHKNEKKLLEKAVGMVI